ncbi:hypothetical protein WH47_08253 [Habropoda laboriosa]|uniref:Uncharacterized protein n=1 Tax=Habropoda laboriosa TaxID=597456 RepID=A0A0L7RG93_9HYME|nr:hypothetical protein WH47_08253 [Habropoda laboriosa]
MGALTNTRGIVPFRLPSAFKVEGSKVSSRESAGIKNCQMAFSSHHRNQEKDFNIRKHQEMQLFIKQSIIYCKKTVQNVFYKRLIYTSIILQHFTVYP